MGEYNAYLPALMLCFNFYIFITCIFGQLGVVLLHEAVHSYTFLLNSTGEIDPVKPVDSVFCGLSTGTGTFLERDECFGFLFTMTVFFRHLGALDLVSSQQSTWTPPEAD